MLVSTLDSLASAVAMLSLTMLPFFESNPSAFTLARMLFSVRPGSSLQMDAQRNPSWLNASVSFLSSSGVKLVLITLGSKWWTHLSRHCFAVLPGRWTESLPQFSNSWATSFLSNESSSAFHCPFFNPGFRTFCQRWRHWTIEILYLMKRGKRVCCYHYHAFRPI